MGVLKIFDVKEDIQGMLGIWELTESCGSLHEQFRFSEKEKSQYEKIINEKRKCEFLAIRLLLQEMMHNKTEISYNNAGKPFLDEKLHLSISHSSDLVAVLLSKQPAGIDVENLGRNIERVAARFLSIQETIHLQNINNAGRARVLYWCAKEALFKCTPMSDIDFKNHISIDPFFPVTDSGKFGGRLIKNNHLANFIFHYQIFKNNAVVYCLETDNPWDQIK